MSSFIVSAQCMNRIVTFLDVKSSRNTIHQSTYRALLAKYLLLPASEDYAYVDTQKLVNTLFDLNIKAVQERYGDSNPSKMPCHNTTNKQLSIGKVHYIYTESSIIQVFKSVQCLIYQCSEGNVPNDPLYKFLEDLENTIAKHIVYELAEYEKANWD